MIFRHRIHSGGNRPLLDLSLSVSRSAEAGFYRGRLGAEEEPQPRGATQGTGHPVTEQKATGWCREWRPLMPTLLMLPKSPKLKNTQSAYIDVSSDFHKVVLRIGKGVPCDGLTGLIHLRRDENYETLWSDDRSFGAGMSSRQ